MIHKWAAVWLPIRCLWGRHFCADMIEFRYQNKEVYDGSAKDRFVFDQLRKEQGMTQEQLGKKLGVTNKTVSRWETGTYLPPVEMLQLLSELYSITINEILCCQRLEEKQFREKAEENLKTALCESAFALKEKIDYYERKWMKDHLFGNIVGTFFVLASIPLLGHFVEDIGGVLGFGLGVILCLVRRNQKMAYIEEHAFDGSGRQ